MAGRSRLDAELVRRGLARSREQAAELIAAGRVTVDGEAAAKAATQVARDTPILVGAGRRRPAATSSRGGHKLAGALAAFGGLAVAGRRCLDAGASTGGFTDVLLRAGAAQVVAADVGYGQLAWSLQTDPRVTVLDRVNVRVAHSPSRSPPPRPDLVVADLSFISLALVLPALVACAAADADFVLHGQAAVRGGQGAGRSRRRGPRRWTAGRRRSARSPRPRRPGPGRARRDGQPAARAVRQRGVLPLAAPRRRHRWTTMPCAQAIAEGPH